MAAWLVAAGVGVAIATASWSGFPAQEDVEAQLKGWMTLLVGALITGELLRSQGNLRGSAGWRLYLAAVLACASFVNLGLFHGDRFHHDWEQFHYSLSAKYFSELGYDGLYAASVQAQLENPVSGRTIHRVVRDLRSNQVVPALSPAHLELGREVKSRFSDERWMDFVRDHEHFIRHTASDQMARMRLDHGFNAPPSWGFVARVLIFDRTLDSAGLDALGRLDLLLLASGVAAVCWAFGTRTACLVCVVFGLSYAGRFFWVGGSLLRHDWVSALLVSASFLARSRPMAAGLAVGYAASVRLFPLLFVLGPLLVAVDRLLIRPRRACESGLESVPEPMLQRSFALRFATGILLAGLAALALGSLAGRGVAVWPEYQEAISLHRGTWLTNNVGMDNLLLHDRETFGRALVDFSSDEPWSLWQERLSENQLSRGWILAVVKCGALTLFGLVAVRIGSRDAFSLGMVPVFIVFLATCYYWQMLALVPLLGSAGLLASVMVLNLLMWILHLRVEGFEVRYGLFSGLLAICFLGYLISRLLRRPEDAHRIELT